jgi:hypothetical protein
VGLSNSNGIVRALTGENPRCSGKDAISMATDSTGVESGSLVEEKQRPHRLWLPHKNSRPPQLELYSFLFPLNQNPKPSTFNHLA